MKAVILAGGYGTRLAEETATIPKPMVEVGGRPILWHIMKIYSQHGINDFVICLGYKGTVIKNFFANYAMNMSNVTFDFEAGTTTLENPRAEKWKVTLVDTGEGTLTGGRLKRVGHLLDDTFCLTYGDGVGDIDITALVDFHKSHGRKATVTAVAPPGRFGLLDLDNHKVSGFVEKPVGDGGRINGGYFVLEPSVLDYIEGDQTTWEQEPMRNLVADGEMQAYFHNGFWRPMDTLRDKQNLEALWQSPDGAPWKSW
ncbi:glucose-1-phosphate cytidylyltransferase [Salipiger bermudensis]|uniref:glucose-1-phosphate cytidylyltransferase n=1 Tax=Salipiger bermudensis TaxID=344736 RepID=UPI001C995FBD|nr:glucose-1-phosphate cytidylyltransferase [Salipiger bermudensis]MBY6006604.1 glucose-1-phosphate cytidylyltransferase [Salipiger bermudensis]